MFSRSGFGRQMGWPKVSLVLVVGAALVGVVALPTEVASATTDTVSTCARSGPGSLPTVVADAGSGDTVTFSVTCPASSPIKIARTIDINRNLTIDGPGASEIVVSGKNAVQDFDIASAVTAKISGITIESGYTSASGGGILNSGTLTVTGSTVSGNSAATYGGGIYSTGYLTVINSAISNNQAVGNDVYGGGGGIGNGGNTMSVVGTTFAGNSAEFGGAISSGEDATVTDSILTGNTATEDGGAFFSSGGSGSGCGGGTDVFAYSTLTDNTAAEGGAAYVVNNLGIENSTISNNTATSADGGGLALTCDGYGGVSNSTVSNNSRQTVVNTTS